MDEWLDFIISNCNDVNNKYIISGYHKTIDKLICMYIKKYKFELLYISKPYKNPKFDMFNIKDFRGINLSFTGYASAGEFDVNIIPMPMDQSSDYIKYIIQED